MSARPRLSHDAFLSGRSPECALLGASASYTVGHSTPATSLTVHGLSAHRAHFGPRPTAVGSAGAALLRTIETAGLTGHGGGHFPVWRKWQAQLHAGGGGTVVANGAESEPASVKDRTLLQFRPHLILDGLVSAAETVCAEEGVVWLHEGAHRSQRSIEQALAERRAHGSADPDIRVVLGPKRYLSGESSAITRGLAGGPVLPHFRRNRAEDSGIVGAPVLVQNVETLARVGMIASIGTEDYAPTTLLSVARGEQRTAVEVDTDAYLTDVIGAVAGVTRAGAPQAALIGGYSGTWRTWDQLVGMRASELAARQRGFSLGAGIVIPVGANECGLAQASAIADYLADSSARQCGPCTFGLRSVADLLGELVRGRAKKADRTRLTRFLSEIIGRGGCHHPDGAVRMINSAVSTFREDVDSHLNRGRCLHSNHSVFVRTSGVRGD